MSSDKKRKLSIEVEGEDVVWLKDGEQRLLGFETVYQLLKELKGVISFNKEEFTITLLDEEKLTEKMLFLC